MKRTKTNLKTVFISLDDGQAISYFAALFEQREMSDNRIGLTDFKYIVFFLDGEQAIK